MHFVGSMDVGKPGSSEKPMQSKVAAHAFVICGDNGFGLMTAASNESVPLCTCNRSIGQSQGMRADIGSGAGG